MMTNYPTSVDTNTQLYLVADNVDIVEAVHHNALKDAIIAVQTALGITGAFNFVTDAEMTTHEGLPNAHHAQAHNLDSSDHGDVDAVADAKGSMLWQAVSGTWSKLTPAGTVGHILVCDNVDGTISWQAPTPQYTDAEAILAVQGEATLELGAQVKIDSCGWLEGGNSPGGSTNMEYNGYFWPTRCYNAVYNDYADYWGTLPEGEDPIPGKVYSTDQGKRLKISEIRGDPAVIGICSDTYGFATGENVGDVPIAVAGFVLAYVDSDLYAAGTRLMNDAYGNLTKVKQSRAIAQFICMETEALLNEGTEEEIVVDGRCWVKVL